MGILLCLIEERIYRKNECKTNQDPQRGIHWVSTLDTCWASSRAFLPSTPQRRTCPTDQKRKRVEVRPLRSLFSSLGGGEGPLQCRKKNKVSPRTQKQKEAHNPGKINKHKLAGQNEASAPSRLRGNYDISSIAALVQHSSTHLPNGLPRSMEQHYPHPCFVLLVH